MRIRKMNQIDLDKISNNLNEFDDFWTINMLKEELNNQSCHYIIAEQSNEILGFGGISIVLDEATIDNIVVRIDKRNQKIGTKILQNLINISKTLKCSFITLEVNTQNTFAIRLYENFGFKKLGIRRNYYKGTMDAYTMKLEIKNNIS